ncbi:DUF669 domain-containing protein [Alicyclobacillus acidoterrestris]|uniref:DUF669 domain-containing protein n=1 Tax=Alicyclobacillus acidoterrestris (strain ATCC 49025 / DSM 3922 / CIP 106132 / NCIMB 13137 / GD3B) TaxID=1356854 RepID=T0BLJ5_ALIAG|nr:DUF669 domain-containing protein [Alicyclobacillus acidoterrestris]EPZ41410.1 hypothetical protein N007_17155 [Alicyclobacillus acidoterrestris ATCC 49025]UNO48958.1 DUF669 domain-containing protein [Alicyclobacillus acidoterrestris]
MTSFRIDYNSITRELLPKGNYEAIIYEAEVRTFSSQNEGILISLVIRDDVEQTSQNMTLNDRLVLVDSALYKFQMVAKAVGLPDDEEIALEDFAVEIINKPVRIYVNHREFNGENQAHVSIYRQGTSFSGDDEDVQGMVLKGSTLFQRMTDGLRSRLGNTNTPQE